MNWPQITFIVLLAISLGMSMADHGKPKEGNENAWTALLGTIITVTLLYFGGFFK